MCWEQHSIYNKSDFHSWWSIDDQEPNCETKDWVTYGTATTGKLLEDRKHVFKKHKNKKDLLYTLLVFVFRLQLAAYDPFEKGFSSCLQEEESFHMFKALSLGFGT